MPMQRTAMHSSHGLALVTPGSKNLKIATDNTDDTQSPIFSATHLQPVCVHPATWPVSPLQHHHLVAMVAQLPGSRQACIRARHI